MHPTTQDAMLRCPACGYPGQIIHVHGHGQCSVCGTNVEPCCGGAPCPTQHGDGVKWRCGDVKK